MIEKIRELMAKRFPCIGLNLKDDSLLRDQGFTSLMFVELILSLEKEFGIEVLDEEIGPGRFSTLERIAEYVQCKLEGKPIQPLPVCQESRSSG